MSIIPDEKGKVKDTFKEWNERKAQSKVLATRLHRLGYEARATRMLNCAEYIVFNECSSCGKKEIATAMLCRDRLCPTCLWRLSRRRFVEMNKVVESMKSAILSNDIHVSMLTLTVRNCKLSELSSTISAMSAAWHNLSRRVAFKRVCGWARNLEITFNKQTREVHPHFHILLLWRGAVDVSKEFYKTLRNEWSHCMKTDYSAIVHHEQAYIIEGDRKTVDVNGDITPILLECSKYAMKATDIPRMKDDELRLFIAAIKGVRFVSYGKDIKKARQALGFKDEELTDGEEENKGKVVCSCGNDMTATLMVWAGGSYVPAPPAEQQKYKVRKELL